MGIVHDRGANVFRLYLDASFIVGKFSLSFCPHHHLPSISCLRLFSLSGRPARLSGKREAMIRGLDDWLEFQGRIYVLIQDAIWKNLIRYSSPGIIIDRKAELLVTYSFRHSGVLYLLFCFSFSYKIISLVTVVLLHPLHLLHHPNTLLSMSLFSAFLPHLHVSPISNPPHNIPPHPTPLLLFPDPPLLKRPPQSPQY